MDYNNSKSEAVIIEDGVITYVGSNEEAYKRVTEDDDLIDAKGNTVLPGFIESHVHVPGNAYNELYNINLFDCKTEVGI